MKKLSFAAVLILLTLPAWATQVAVSITDFAFNPSTVNVQVGDTVHWTNNGYYIHTSTSGAPGVPDGKWDSGDISPGSSFSHAFTSAGSFDYFCRHHYNMGMTGTVNASGSGIDDNRGPGTSAALAVRGLPNPFRSSTTLVFGSAAAGATMPLRIYDAQGRLVRSLAVAAGAGQRCVTWDGRNDHGQRTPAGVYYIVTRAGSLALMESN